METVVGCELSLKIWRETLGIRQEILRKQDKKYLGSNNITLEIWQEMLRKYGKIYLGSDNTLELRQKYLGNMTRNTWDQTTLWRLWQEIFRKYDKKYSGNVTRNTWDQTINFLNSDAEMSSWHVGGQFKTQTGLISEHFKGSVAKKISVLTFTFLGHRSVPHCIA